MMYLRLGALLALLFVPQQVPQEGAEPPPRQELDADTQQLFEKEGRGKIYYNRLKRWLRDGKYEAVARGLSQWLENPQRVVSFATHVRGETGERFMAYLEAYHPEVALPIREKLDHDRKLQELQERIGEMDVAEHHAELILLARDPQTTRRIGGTAVRKLASAPDLPEVRKFFEEELLDFRDGPRPRVISIAVRIRVVVGTLAGIGRPWAERLIERVVIEGRPGSDMLHGLRSQEWHLEMAARADERVKTRILRSVLR